MILWCGSVVEDLFITNSGQFNRLFHYLGHNSCIQAGKHKFLLEKANKTWIVAFASQANSAIELFSFLIRCSENDISRAQFCIAYSTPHLTSKAAQSSTFARLNCRFGRNFWFRSNLFPLREATLNAVILSLFRLIIRWYWLFERPMSSTFLSQKENIGSLNMCAKLFSINILNCSFDKANWNNF